MRVDLSQHGGRRVFFGYGRVGNKEGKNKNKGGQAETRAMCVVQHAARTETEMEAAECG